MNKKKITRATLLGAATGDALGVPVEFMSREDVRKIGLTEMVGCDTPLGFQSQWGKIIPAGAWSDDTSLAVATMMSIVDFAGMISYEDILQQFDNWWHYGSYASISRPFGLGGTVHKALINYANCLPAVKCGPTDDFSNGNGSLMRIFPFSLYCIFNGFDTATTARIINTGSGITHGHPISKMGCFIFTLFLKELLTGLPVEEAWENTRRFDYTQYYTELCISAYSHLLSDEFPTSDESAIGETGYVVDTLMTAVRSMLHGGDYESSVLCAINMGYDTDTAAAVTGALAGAYYGLSSIPKRWLSKLRKKDELIWLADQFAKAVVLT